MPRVSAFYGILIFMYWNEGDHPVAHFHAHYAGQRASISLDGSVLCWAPGGPGSWLRSRMGKHAHG